MEGKNTMQYNSMYAVGEKVKIKAIEKEGTISIVAFGFGGEMGPDVIYEVQYFNQVQQQKVARCRYGDLEAVSNSAKARCLHAVVESGKCCACGHIIKKQVLFTCTDCGAYIDKQTFDKNKSICDKCLEQPVLISCHTCWVVHKDGDCAGLPCGSETCVEKRSYE